MVSDAILRRVSLGHAASTPVFTIVTAVYDVEAYLPDFIASIEAQTFDPTKIRVIAVDDGSTDGSPAILEAWARRRPTVVTVLHQANGGQGSARNLGLAEATGTWMTFTDPDDMLDPDFFAVAERFALAKPDVAIMASKPWLLEEAKGRVTDTHPRRAQYEAGDRRVDLDREPNSFPGSATVSLFRLDRIRALGLRFDGRIRPNFEDGHFTICFLLGLEAPVAGILRDARYIYRKRAAGDSTLQRAFRDPGRYTDVFRYGYLDVLERGRARTGSVPAWLQHVLIYELSWYLSSDEGSMTRIRIAPDLVPTFHELLGQVVRQLDPEVIARHTVRPLKSIWSDILAHAFREDDWHSPMVARTKVDPRMGLQRLSYRYVGTPPSAGFEIDGAPVAVAYGKAMSHDYFGRTLLLERIAWVPTGKVARVALDGAPVPISDGWPEPRKRGRPTGRLERLQGARRLTPTGALKAIGRTARRRLARFAGRPTRLVAGRWPFGPLYRDAWVLIDRLYDADDNAERLFEYLRAERPDVNAWFVVERDSAVWRRMRAAGVKRLVAYGSFRWRLLMLDCAWLLSSHADIAVTAPPTLMRILPRRTWRYGFLQHGVIKDDLSRWLNPKDIDFFVVSTRGRAGVDRRGRHRLPGHVQGDARHGPAAFRPIAGQGEPPSAGHPRPGPRRPHVAAVADRIRRPGHPATCHLRRVLDLRLRAQLGRLPAFATDRRRCRAPRSQDRVHAASEHAAGARPDGPPGACRGHHLRGHRRPGPLCPLRTARDRLLLGRLQHRVHRRPGRLLPVRP